MKLRNMRMKYGTYYMADGDGDGSGGGGGSWRDGLGEDFKESKALADFKDIDGLAKAYLDTKADIGRSLRIPGPDASPETIAAFNASLTEKVPGLTRIPGEGATDEDRAAFYSSLGRPAEASGYRSPETDNEMLKESLATLAKAAHAQGLTQTQYEAVATSLMAEHAEDMEALTQSQKDEQDKLKLDWGSSLGAKQHAILEMAKQTGAPDSIVDAITGKSLDSGAMKWLDGLVDTLSGPGSQMDFQGDQHASRVSPDEAQRQVAEIMDNPAYWDAANPQQAGLVKKAVELQKIALSVA